MADTWIIPCNTKYFDIAEHFRTKNEVIWRNYFTIKTNDIVYVYIGGDTRQIKYRCVAIESSVDDTVLAENTYAIRQKKINNYFSKKEKYMRLRLEYTYPDGALTYEQLKDNGLGQVKLQARPDRHVRQYIDSVNLILQRHISAGDEND